ncbi:MAG: glycine cleavage system protein GcvH [Candidatus Bathyarchaeota archaeon]|nr:MAG: glycine cleavage system protein GcvH [Candidatus Bathyarchaeota archaeon]
MKVNEFNVPKNLFYTKDHEWISLENGNVVKVGITDYAQKGLHEIVFVDLSNEGTRVERANPLGTVESVKAVSEVFSPVSGYILKVNEDLQMNPELVNKDPYGQGWMVLIKTNNWNIDFKNLLSSTQYVQFIEELILK